MSSGTAYVIGAGLSGLSAAVALTQRGMAVCLLEAAGHAGGRCRSYLDPVLDQVIDNGNHLILSGNHATFEYLNIIGSAGKLAGPDQANFDFMDVRDGARWTIRANDGLFPWWVLSSSRRVPGSKLSEYLALTKLLSPPRGKRINEVIACHGAVWEKLLQPLLIAALNTEPETASADLASAIIRETLAKGGRAYRPRIASPTLSAALIDPAMSYLNGKQADIRFGSRLREISKSDDRVISLKLSDKEIPLSGDDVVVLATSAPVTADLLPQTSTPTEFRSIVNAHFVHLPPPGARMMTGVIGGTAEWVFAFHDRLSVTVSSADKIVDRDRETLAKTLWRDVAAVHRLGPELPPWQIVKERRATFAATPQQAVRRPPAETAWKNLFLAGDWTDTGLPATIEGAVRSGQRAASLALRRVA